jgi:hypothetical protein
MKHAIVLLPGFLWFSVASGPGAGADQAVELKLAPNHVEVVRGDLRLEFDAGGRGLLTKAWRGDKAVGSASPSSGLFASLLAPKGPVPFLEPVAGDEVPGAVTVTSVTARKVGEQVEVRIRGSVDFPRMGAGTFLVTIRTPPTGPALAVTAELQWPEKARPCALASFGVAIPLGLNIHPTSKTGATVDGGAAAVAILPRAGTPVPEVRSLVAEQDQTSVWGPMLWSLAGIRQSAPRSMEVWEAWSPLNPAFVLQHHQVHPGWMAVADGQHVVAAAMRGIEQIAPKEIFVDSQARLLRICFQSPHCRPLDLRLAPASLVAGPAYVFFDTTEPRTRKAEAYLEAKNRPRLGLLDQDLAGLPRTECNFSSRPVSEPRTPGDASAGPPKGGTLAEAELRPADAEFLSHEPSRPDEIMLWVDEPQGKDFEVLPITRGVPLARGVLKDEKQASLTDAEGRLVFCAARALAFWPDGSVKWLLLDFAPSLKAGVGGRFRLTVGDRAQPLAMGRPVSTGEAADEISADTGKLRLTLRNKNKKLALTIGLDLNGDGEVEEGETIINNATDLLGCMFSHVADPGIYQSGTWRDAGRPDAGVAEVTELRVEEQSPLRAVLLVRAILKHPWLATTIPPQQRPPAGTPVTLRLHLYAHSSLVRLQHTFMFAGDVRYDFLRQLGVRLPFPVGALAQFRTALDGAGQSLSTGPSCGLLQDGPDSALAWQNAGDQPRILARGQKADGWIEGRGERWGVTVGLRHMREMCPQEIEADRDGIWTHFYSPRAVPMDVRRYAFKYGDGESSSTGFGSAFGALRTHEACWHFFPARAAAAEPKLVRAILDPPLARVRPRYVADTLAVGHVAEQGASANYPHFDAVMLHLPRLHQHNQQFWRWFGFWDFGDEIQVYDSGRQRWSVDDGRYGWYNNEPLRDYNYHLAFLLTGNRRIWEQAEAMSYHVFEVDVRHAKPQPFMSAAGRIEKQEYDHSTTQGLDLCGRRHNCQHWADGYFGPRVGSPAGFRLCYYQNGDPVMREYLTRLIASALATRRSQYMAADGDEAVLWAMLTGYEMTRDAKYVDRIRGYANLQVEFARNHSGFPAAQANWDWASNTAGAPPADPRDDLWIWSFGGHVALIETADLLGDPKLEEMLRHWVLALEGFGPDQKRRESWANNMAACPLLAYYYRRTGDTRALEWCQKRLKGFHSQIPKAAPTADLPVRVMADELPGYTPNDGYGWVYSTSTFWYVGIPAWQGALRAHARN